MKSNGLQKFQFPYSLVNWEKLRGTTNWGRKNFKLIENFAHTAEFLTLGKFDLLMFYPRKQLVKVTFNNDFMMNKELNLCKV